MSLPTSAQLKISDMNSSIRFTNGNVGIGTTIKRAHTKKSRNDHWHNIVNKVGYDVEIIYEDISWEEACEKEIELIKKYGNTKNLRDYKLFKPESFLTSEDKKQLSNFLNDVPK